LHFKTTDHGSYGGCAWDSFSTIFFGLAWTLFFRLFSVPYLWTWIEGSEGRFCAVLDYVQAVDTTVAWRSGDVGDGDGGNARATDTQWKEISYGLFSNCIAPTELLFRSSYEA